MTNFGGQKKPRCPYRSRDGSGKDRTCTEERKSSHRKRGLGLKPAGEKRRERPGLTWRRTIRNEAVEKGKSWNEVKRMAGSRTRWRCFVDALCPLRDDRNMMMMMMTTTTTTYIK